MKSKMDVHSETLSSKVQLEQELHSQGLTAKDLRQLIKQLETELEAKNKELQSLKQVKKFMEYSIY